jgi:hypothetical protein
LLLWVFAGLCDAETWMQQSVTQRGMTWYFDKEYKVGQFANGDYWVLGPVTITRIAPDFDGTNNGWEVNPIVTGGQGFQNQTGYGFNPSLVPSLPYTTGGTVSIVKTTPTGVPGQVIIKGAAVLTVVADIPPGDGALVFRPPYVGTEKPFYRVADLKTNLLPAYAPVTPMPTLATVAARFQPLQMDHKTGAIGRALRPADNMDDYQPANTPAQNEAALRLMMNDTLTDKRPALINFVQFGIDKIHTIYLGQTWPDGGGHQPGHLIVAAYAAVLLDLQQAKDVLRAATFFHGTRWFYRGRDSRVLWGGSGTEYNYWNYIMTGSGNRSIKDPYGYIDGGKAPEGSYQVITSQSHKGEILATHLMPALKDAWPATEWAMIQEYADRWVNIGQWTQPDPIAPYDGNPANYGVTFGPDPNNPGMAILGSGRFPATHGANKDGGQYRSLYVAAMWNAYRNVMPGTSITQWRVVATHGAAEIVTVVADNFIEPRAQGLRKFRVEFSGALDPATVNTAVVAITGDTSGNLSGRVSSVTLVGDRTLEITLSSALPNPERCTVAVLPVLHGAGGQSVSGDLDLRVATLIGDVNASGKVTAADVLAVRDQANKPVTGAAASHDINGSGTITGADMMEVRARLGSQLP